jgi:hypothetical protein
MCVMIDWRGKKMVDQQGQLGRHVSTIVLKDGHPSRTRDDDACLCPVDVPATLDGAGVHWERKPGIPEYEVTSGD